MDAAFIKQCADPALKPAIVEQFVSAVGSGEPLAVTVRSGGRLILVPKPKTPEEAMGIVRQYVGQAVVRVGVTQFPAGVGVKDTSEITSDLVEPCENLRKGSTMFAKILRIVTKWYGNPKSAEVFPQIFDDAVYAWKTGQFEGQAVFQAQDPGGVIANHSDEVKAPEAQPADDAPVKSEAEPSDASDIEAAGIRIDLSRIGGQK
ncbi:conjugal transfer protein TraH [Rhizobium cauense]|uniref:TraH family protein n=1 Tax=Rhizobium cauense TaxID=1166683 RepID=UPI001C6F1D37|nr:TraH family protein [Rhizobium cauense]MBW9116384.1 conjugal transfer protein TraH [Rhizobium cauense]